MTWARTTALALSVVLTAGSFTAVASAAEAPAVCASGPASSPKPENAVVVDPGEHLAIETSAHPPGTAFWLSTGTHILADDPYSQVIPKDGNVYVGAPGAVLDGRGINRAAFTQQAKDVVIRGLTIRGFVAPQDQGVVNHDSGEHWVIEGNVIEHNRGAAMMAGPRQEVLGNCLRKNGQYGINAYRAGGGITGLVVEGNEIAWNNTDDWEKKQPGCGCSGGAKFWAVDGADIRGNWVHHNHGAGLWADTNNNDFIIEDNTIEDNDAEALFYEISYNLIIRSNTFRRNALVLGRDFAARGNNFPIAAVYLSESGGEPRIWARTDMIEIAENVFEDNWGGLTLWENADRFCNSPSNTSTGTCTRVVASPSDCAPETIAREPAYDDCRWKTQRVNVHDNVFQSAPDCTGLCGRMAVLSNYGTYPSWSPYRGNAVSEAVTFAQDNEWFSNTYVGHWSFVAHDASRSLDVVAWRAAPYGQDPCSTFDGAGGCPAR
ncbi:right-handed parallel beta-helix repeat-containing protein [Amycolatopsis sp. cmx-4-54]|uniref:right-handed parallel beta-helix repeat-containing protein n=1 Tax=Amycolatopsis sp. cmx-4-54 TaxID=2790936 RepID=UPI00397AFD57